MKRMAYVELDKTWPVKCICPNDLAIREGDKCVITRSRILELGCVVRIEELSQESGEKPEDDLPVLVRRATLQDQAKADENNLMQKMASEKCVTSAEKHKLDIKIISARYSFDRSHLTVVFASDERVDFREMIRDLSDDLHARIEMRQIGVRDVAGIVGGMAICGRQLCCCTWIHDFASINVKMAKSQRLSLNPSAISGMCGRLMCCLKYENEQYIEADRCLPRDGASVKCAEGEGCVCGKDIMAQRLMVRLDDNRIINCPADEVQQIASRARKVVTMPEYQSNYDRKDDL